ncbi:MAG TPA: PAS domain S-box protein [Polyangiaceae bacterium]|nr:PAS domain S-box protein [Polyangiaceae bacterium]
MVERYSFATVRESEPILVVEDDAASREVIVALLGRAGLPAVAVADATTALEWLEGELPSLVLLDVMLPGMDGYELLQRFRKTEAWAHLPVVVLTALDSEEAIERSFACGADDFCSKPVRSAELVARVHGQLRIRDYVERLSRRERDLRIVVELIQTLASRLDIRDILFTLVTRLAAIARVDRCSLVLLGERPDIGYVVATSDNEQLRDLPINLSKYPEIQEALASGATLVIRDAARHPLLDAVRQRDGLVGFASLALLPLVHEGRAMGVLFLRARRHVAFETDEMTLLQTVAHATAISLRNARILQELRKETQQNVQARAEAEHRMLLFQRYRDFFESSADGIVVIDQAGRILFANPRAREITGFSETDLAEVKLGEVLPPEEQKRALRLARGFRESIYPQGVDVRIRTKHGEEVVLSVNFSSVLREEGAVLFTFRDVTSERKTEIELKQTKEFFERVIESSVDAIVSASLDGRVLLFNRAASRVFGYEPSEVIGKMSVEKLYPPGVAREVMRKIRDPSVCGPARLEDYRVDMLNSAGEVIAVKLSAALIMENDHPVGSVGIFTDIRDKLRMEAKLLRTQEELREREKHAAVAELAGAAAHELNQPLTSIIGYAELLCRRLEKESPLHNAADIIIAQAERMAEIVRKIGKITKYETKSYVGGQKILDLDKATSDPERKGALR